MADNSADNPMVCSDADGAYASAIMGLGSVKVEIGIEEGLGVVRLRPIGTGADVLISFVDLPALDRMIVGLTNLRARMARQ